MMSRNDFDKLDINKQVEYLNSLLEGSYNSFKGVTNVIGIPDSTLRSRLRQNGFKYNSSKIKITKFDFHTKANKKILKNTPSNNKNTFVIDEDFKNRFEELYSWYKKQQNLKSKSKILLINPSEFKETTTSKTFKIYNNVLEELEKFCYKNRQYSVQAIVNTALLQLIKKYS